MPVKVERKSNETDEQLLRRFRKKIAHSRMMSEVRRRRWYVSKSEVERIQKKKAKRRAQKRQFNNRNYR